MNPVKKFLAFAHNYRRRDMESLFPKLTNPSHFKNKWDEFSYNEGNGSKGFIRLFYYLSDVDQETVLEHINQIPDRS